MRLCRRLTGLVATCMMLIQQARVCRKDLRYAVNGTKGVMKLHVAQLRSTTELMENQLYNNAVLDY